VLKPFLRGRDVKRWRSESEDFWLIYLPWHFPLHDDASITSASSKAEIELKKKYPAIYRHLSKTKAALEKRDRAETGIRYEWYALARPRYESRAEFDQPKIIIPSIQNDVRYAPDEHFSASVCPICISDTQLFRVLVDYPAGIPLQAGRVF
jgi:hypothetical protein